MGGGGHPGGRELEGWGRRGMLGPVPRGVVPTGKGGVNPRRSGAAGVGGGAFAGSLWARLGFAPAGWAARWGEPRARSPRRKPERTTKWGRPGWSRSEGIVGSLGGSGGRRRVKGWLRLYLFAGDLLKE